MFVLGLSKQYLQYLYAGDPVMLKEKVLSILGHITNQHSFPENTMHLKCVHDDLGPDELRTKPFVSKNSVSARKLEKALRGAHNSRYRKLIKYILHCSILGWMIFQ